jgi:hypothetical protein
MIFVSILRLENTIINTFGKFSGNFGNINCSSKYLGVIVGNGTL